MFPVILVGALALTTLASCKRGTAGTEEKLVARATPGFPNFQIETAAHRKAPPASTCPEAMAEVENFCIDRYEAHLVVDGEIHPHNRRPSSSAAFTAASGPGIFPQGYISRVEADRACVRAGKRLCTLAEWLQACHGSPALSQAHREPGEKSRCNQGKPHLLVELLKKPDPKTWSYEGDFNNPILNETPGFLARTGEFAECASERGLMDMVGNLHEWVSDTVDASLNGKIPLIPPIRKKLPDNAGHGIFMGGFYSTVAQHGEGCGFITIGHEPGYHDYSTGFRCCSERQNSQQ